RGERRGDGLPLFHAPDAHDPLGAPAVDARAGPRNGHDVPIGQLLTTMRTSWLASTFLTLGVALSCSVLNAPEDLITSIAGSGGQGGDSGGGDGGSAGDSGTGSNSNTGSGGDPSFMP